jgi:hypothetical protein
MSEETAYSRVPQQDKRFIIAIVSNLEKEEWPDRTQIIDYMMESPISATNGWDRDYLDHLIDRLIELERLHDTQEGLTTLPGA